MPLAITNQQIEELLETDFDWATYQRGLLYFERDMIIDQMVDGHMLITNVRGSGNKKYQQTVIFSVFKREIYVKNNCSCPVGHNCKHMVAALLYYIEHNPEEEFDYEERDELDDWLDHASDILQQHNDQRQASASEGEFSLHYIIEPRVSGYHGEQLFVEIKKTKWLKSGRWGKGNNVKPYQIAYKNDYWVKTIDQEIAGVLIDGYREHEIPLNQLGAFILKKMVETGRCYYLDNSNPALSLGDDKQVNFKWSKRKAGRKLNLSLKGVPNWRLISTDPLYYIDQDNQQLGLLKQPLAIELFKKLSSLPELNEDQQKTFSQFTLEQLPAKSLPMPVKLDITPWVGTPTPVVTLLTNYDQLAGGIPLLRLQFEYSPMIVEADADIASLPAQAKIIEHNKQRWQLQRDHQFEIECLNLLTEQHLCDAKNRDIGIKDQFTLYMPAVDKEQLAGRWYHFEQQLEQLKEQGWKVIIDDSYGFDFDTVDTIEAQVEEHDSGWFDLGFNVTSEGKSIALLPLILQWLEQKNPDMPLLIEVENGKWQAVPKTVIQPVLDTLMELYQTPTLNENGQLQMPRQQAHNLNSLADEINLEWQGGDKVRELGEKLANFAGIEQVSVPKGVNAELRHYQQDGLNWLNFLREYGFSGILADDMGLGKTLQTLTFLQHELEAGRLTQPTLIVAPTSVLHNWQNEAQKFTPELTSHIHHGGKRYKKAEQLGEFKLIITSYALLQRDLELFKELKLYGLILDEAQTIKNAKAKTAKAARELPAQFRLCLTGTPMENHLGEMWSLFHFLMPGLLSNEKQFNRLFRTPIEKNGETAPMKTLTSRIAPFVLRRTKNEVATELPPKTEMIRSVEMGAEQGKLYETVRLAMEKKVNSLIQSKGANRSHIEMLDALLKLRQICCDPQLLKLESAKKVKQSAKLDLLMEMLEELLEEGRKILLFSQFTGMLSIIEAEIKKRNIGFSKITGQTQKREKQVEQFQAGEVPLFLISLKAGGTGLNLTAADTVIHYDPWWNPAAENQATDRAYRIGQDKPVFVYKLVTENSVEEKILELQKRKQALADDLYGDEQQEPMKKMGADDLLALFT